MPFLVAAFVGRAVVVHDGTRAEPAAAARIGAQAVVGERERLRHAPFARQREMGHRLAQLGLFVRMLDQVRLVDYVDQVARLRDTPEDAVDAETQLPLILAEFAEQQQIGFAQIGVGAVRIAGVQAIEAFQGDAAALFVLQVEPGCHGKAARVGALIRVGARLRIPSAVHAHAAGELVVVDPVCRARLGGKGRSQEAGGTERGAAQADAKSHQRTRFRPVRVKSRSSRSVPNSKSDQLRSVLLPVTWFTIAISPACQKRSR